MLLPFAAKATAPLAGSLLSGIAGKLFLKKMVFKRSILISNDIWEKVKSNNNNFSSIKKKKKSSPLPIKNPKLQEEEKQKLPTIPKNSIRYVLNERAKERRKKSNLMKNAKLLKEIRADEEILKFFRPNEKPFIYKLLKFLRMNGDVITWGDDTLEVNITG